jgi:hypothetical protein
MALDFEDINKRLDDFLDKNSSKKERVFRQFEPIGDDDYVVEFPKGPTTTYYTVKKDTYNKLKADTIKELNLIDDKYDPRYIELRTILVMLDWIHTEPNEKKI